MSTRVRRSMGVIVSVLVTVIALVTFLAAGCGAGVDSAEGLLQLGEPDNGQSFAVGVGDTIEVMLPGNPTTGFEWAAAISEEDATLLEQQGEPAYVSESSGETVVGGGGVYTFTFKTVAKGQAELKLVYARPFESVPPEQTFTVALTIE
jgi:predicted secreted protein